MTGCRGKFEGGPLDGELHDLPNADREWSLVTQSVHATAPTPGAPIPPGSALVLEREVYERSEHPVGELDDGRKVYRYGYVGRRSGPGGTT